MTDQLRISATLYTTWKKCPAQAAARLDGYYPTDTIASFKGLLAHRIFARHLSSGHIAPSGFRQVCQQEIGSSNLNRKVKNLALKPSQIQATISQVADLYRRFTTLKPVGTPEIHVEHTLTDTVTLIGTIDCVQGTDAMPRLVDWKTGELGDAADQLDFYALLWWLSGRPMPLSVTAVSVGTGEKYEMWVDRTRLDSLTLTLAGMVADLSAGSTPETPGPWCRWCPILETCEPGRQTMGLLG